MIKIDRKSITDKIEYYKKELAIVEDLITLSSHSNDAQLYRRSYYLRNIRYLERILFFYDKYLDDFLDN